MNPFKALLSIFCPECGRRFESLRGLVLHFRKHISPYCPVCKENFKNIRSHIRQRNDPAHKLLYALITESDDVEINVNATLSDRENARQVFYKPELIIR